MKELTDADVLNGQQLDEDLLLFLVKLQKYLKDTIVVMMSDQGVSPPQVPEIKSILLRQSVKKTGDYTSLKRFSIL